MTDTGTEYIEKVLRAAPFADNEAGIPEMCALIKALAAERDGLIPFKTPRHGWKYINAGRKEDLPPKDGTMLLLFGAVNYDERSSFPDESWERDFLIGSWRKDMDPVGWHSKNTNMELIKPFLWCPIYDPNKV